mmetsp:Transcript_71793/g.215811  ORF Transcript_71793/g.215811 Transcript_71793/m.215811 type:complete len:739 (+) Transcript_71793:414-2630(+)
MVPLSGLHKLPPCTARSHCPGCVATEVWLATLGGRFCALAVNLNRSLHDPFTKPQSRMKTFHAWIWGTSFAVGISVGVLHEFRPNLHLCWSCHGIAGVYSWVLLFGWLIVYWSVAVVIMLDAWYWLIHARMVTERLSSRATQLRSSVVHVVIIGSQWVLTGISFALIFEPSDKWQEATIPQSLLPYRVCFALSLGLLGVADLISWLSTSLPILHEIRLQNRLRKLIMQSDMEQLEMVQSAATSDGAGELASDFTQGDDDPDDASLPAWFGGHMLEGARNKRIKSKNQKKKREDLGDISDALRREFVQFTIMGIAESARRAQEAAKRAASELASRRDASNRSHAEVEMESHERGATSAAASSSDRRVTASDGEAREVAKRVLISIKDSALRRNTSAIGPSDTAPETAGLPAEAQQLAEAFGEVQVIELAPAVYFSDLAPLVFEKLRTQIFHVSNSQFISSIWGDSPSTAHHQGEAAINVVDQMVLSFSEGKGGGFFFWSLDRRFMVKTLEPSEYAGLKSLLPRYYRHLWSRPGSLLSRYYGAYSITIHGHTKHFVVMESVFHSAPGGKVHEIYDLKGSWIDRHSNLPDASMGTYKDLDLKKPFQLPHANAAALLEDLSHDSELLETSGLMDYSLLVGVHNHPVAVGALHLEIDGLVAQSVDVPRYYIGVIDMLQDWNMNKRIERLAKIVLKGRWGKNVRAGMSAIEPTAYRKRFLAGVGYQLGLLQSSVGVAKTGSSGI